MVYKTKTKKNINKNIKKLYKINCLNFNKIIKKTIKYINIIIKTKKT